MATKKQTLFCKPGNHKWTRKSQRGKPPGYCPKHVPEAAIKTGPVEQELYCQTGKHTWKRMSKRGRKPPNCPEHTPVVVSSGEDALTSARRVKSEKATVKRSAIIKEILESPRAANCKCDLKPGSTDEEIRALNGGCTSDRSSHTSPGFVCPVLVTVRNRVSRHWTGDDEDE